MLSTVHKKLQSKSFFKRELLLLNSIDQLERSSNLFITGESVLHSESLQPHKLFEATLMANCLMYNWKKRSSGGAISTSNTSAKCLEPFLKLRQMSQQKCCSFVFFWSHCGRCCHYTCPLQSASCHLVEKNENSRCHTPMPRTIKAVKIRVTVWYCERAISGKWSNEQASDSANCLFW